MLLDYNDTSNIFILKGEEEIDDREIIRSPESTRPIGMKNKDNTTISAVTNNSLKFDIARDACSTQRGFLPGRNFVNNIVDLDAVARIYASDSSLFHPVLAFWDFGSAFPSLIHAWLFIILRVIGLPDGAYNIKDEEKTSFRKFMLQTTHEMHDNKWDLVLAPSFVEYYNDHGEVWSIPVNHPILGKVVNHMRVRGDYLGTNSPSGAQRLLWLKNMKWSNSYDGGKIEYIIKPNFL